MLFLEVTQMYTRVYLYKTILVTEIIWLSIFNNINNFGKKYYF